MDRIVILIGFFTAVRRFVFYILPRVWLYAQIAYGTALGVILAYKNRKK